MFVNRKSEPARPVHRWQSTFPMELKSRNWWDHTISRGGRMARVRRAKQEKTDVGLQVLRMLDRANPTLPLRVTMTRISPRRFDADNLGPQGAFKHVQDGIAAVLKVDDGDQRITWVCGQEKGKPHQVRIEITETI